MSFKHKITKLLLQYVCVLLIYQKDITFILYKKFLIKIDNAMLISIKTDNMILIRYIFQIKHQLLSDNATCEIRITVIQRSYTFKM